MSTTLHSLEKIDELVDHIQGFRYEQFLELYLKTSLKNRVAALVRAGFLDKGRPDSDILNKRYMAERGTVEQVVAVVRWMRDRQDMEPLREAKSEVKRLQALVLEHQDDRQQKNAAIEYLIGQRDTLIGVIAKLMEK